MKATSFLEMVTLLTATAKSDKEIDEKLSKLILLYNKPPKSLHTIFSNLFQLELCPDDYYDNKDNTLHFDSDIFTLIWDDQQFILQAPKNINELIAGIKSTQTDYELVFQEKIINEIGFNSTFRDLMSVYGLQ